MIKKKRADFAKERAVRSLIDGLSTNIYDKKGKKVFKGKDHADELIKRVLRR